MIRIALILAALTALSACASITAEGPGPFTYNNSVTVDLGKTWTAYPRNGRADSQTLTIDGQLLNQLYFGDEIEDGDSLIYLTSREKIVPKFRADMNPSEIAEFIADSLSYVNFQNVETTGLRPEPFGELDGLRFDMTADTTAGLNMAGTVKAAFDGKHLRVILYLAPTTYYYGLHRDEVENIMQSVRFAS